MSRTTIGLAAAAFVIVGFVLWVAGMPRPSSAPLQAAYAADPVGAGAATPAPTLAPGEIGVASDEWLLSTASATGIPIRVLEGYANAAIAQQQANPNCELGWNVLAAIGGIESDHGRFGGARIGEDGNLIGSILGPRLDGVAYDAVPDTDGGRLDGDAEFDRAVGPLQFLPATWAAYATDGNGDGVADPTNIDDASLSAAAYLCEGGRVLSDPDGWDEAITAYNPNDRYLIGVTAEAIRYGEAAG
jgi:membrane-bound lytic murein transglycosylase B